MFLHAELPKSTPPPSALGGLFVVLYGINNLGKSTQAKLLVERLEQQNIPAAYVKYPVYDEVPSGVLINNYLRQGNVHKLSGRELDILQAFNRTQYEPELIKKINQGVTVVAEDYTGTGIAWGVGHGVDEQFLKYINSHLRREDIGILLDGERFTRAVEANHRHETDNELTARVRQSFGKLAREYGWPVVNANRSVADVHADIWRHVAARRQSRLPETLPLAVARAYPTPDTDKIDVTYINRAPNEQLNPGLKKIRLSSRHEQAAPSNALTVAIRRVTPDAKLPTRAHATDAGLDLYANNDYTLFENDITPLATGISMAIPDGYAGLIWDKSGLASGGLKTVGGVIDAGFRGEIKVVATNLSGDVIHIARGQKIAQIIIQKIEAPMLAEADALDETKRQNDGFGSTGVF